MLIIDNPLCNLHSADTFLGPEGAPWIEVALYSVSTMLGKILRLQSTFKFVMVKEIQDFYQILSEITKLK